MNSDATLASTVRSEWIKFRTVRSSILGVAITLLLTIGLGVLVTSLVRAHWSTMSVANKLTFDPVGTSLVGVIFAQFAMGVIGTLFITSEYSAGSIRTTLAAVPNRVRLITAKFIVLVTSAIVIGEFAAFVAFFIGQAIFSGVVPTASLSQGDVLRAVIFAGVYLTILASLGFTIGLLIRHSAAAISIFVSILLVLPLIMAFLPQNWQNASIKYLPGEGLGQSMTSVSPTAHLFGPWTSFLILLVYLAVLLVLSTTLFARRDA
jgi:ABC-2 type transport system permease protein